MKRNEELFELQNGEYCILSSINSIGFSLLTKKNIVIKADTDSYVLNFADDLSAKTYKDEIAKLANIAKRRGW
ncbi:MAG: hypothetical protein ACUZ8H_13155 [Candidatus Anammoxibacter sp.]